MVVCKSMCVAVVKPFTQLGNCTRRRHDHTEAFDAVSARNAYARELWNNMKAIDVDNTGSELAGLFEDATREGVVCCLFVSNPTDCPAPLQ